jgi:hypothetical protein
MVDCERHLEPVRADGAPREVDARVVHQDVNGAVSLGDLVGRVANRRERREVHDEVRHVGVAAHAPHLVGRQRNAHGVATEHDDRCALPGKAERRRFAEPAVGAGDEADASSQCDARVH